VHESDPASRAGKRRLVGGSLLAAAVAIALVVLSGSASPSSAAAPTLAQLVGQQLLVRMQGSTPSAAFLRRIRKGEIGGVVLFQNNATPLRVPALVAKLQAAARAGGRLPLLIAVDQEGGVVKRLPGPPTAAPRAMQTAAAARAQGLATGRYGDRLPAACSPSIVAELLRRSLHFHGVTLSDDLDTAAVSSHFTPSQAAVRAVKAGIDMVFVAGVDGSGGDAVGEEAYAALLRAAQTGSLSRSSLEASYARIAALKSRFS
jgi:beta-glucosidase-like glycosyl hydrolase